MKNIEVIVFDLGGVLVELGGVASMLRWSTLDLDEADLWRRWLSSPGVRAFESGRIDKESFAEQIIAELNLSTDSEQFLQAYTAWPTGLYPGVPDLLASLRKQFTLACLSNTSELHWDRLMGEMGLQSHLHHHYASHLMGKIKPDLECFEYLLQDLDLNPAQVLFFDDNEINVTGARKVGLNAAIVKGVGEARQYLAENGLFEQG